MTEPSSPITDHEFKQAAWSSILDRCTYCYQEGLSYRRCEAPRSAHAPKAEPEAQLPPAAKATDRINDLEAELAQTRAALEAAEVEKWKLMNERDAAKAEGVREGLQKAANMVLKDYSFPSLSAAIRALIDAPTTQPERKDNANQ